MTTTLRRIVLARRPQGAPVPEDFRLETGPLPEPGPGEALVRTIWLSLDPYMRGRMSDAPSYAKGVDLGGVIEGEGRGRGRCGAATRRCSRAISSAAAAAGSLSSVCRPRGCARSTRWPAPPSTALGVLGMPGLTAYAGLLGIGRPQAGETVVVGAASGPVGSLAGQIARRKGCRVIGVAGGPEKCAWVTGELGFDACLDRRLPDLAGRLAAACPDGIDIYVELVGGEPCSTPCCRC